MLAGDGPSTAEYREIDARNRIFEAQQKLDQPKIDALKAEAQNLKDAIDPEEIRSRHDFLQQFKDTLVRAENFAKAIFPEPLP